MKTEIYLKGDYTIERLEEIIAINKMEARTYKAIPATKEDFALILTGLQMTIYDYEGHLEEDPISDVCKRQIKRYTELLNKLKSL